MATVSIQITHDQRPVNVRVPFRLGDGELTLSRTGYDEAGTEFELSEDDQEEAEHKISRGDY